MEKLPITPAPIENNESKDVKSAGAVNFHEVFLNRKGFRKAKNELGEIGGGEKIFDKHYKKPLEETESEASDFKIEKHGGNEILYKYGGFWFAI